MTPSERERRTRAAAEAMEDAAIRLLGRDLGTLHRDHIAEYALDAADEAVPMVSEAVVREAFRGGYERGVTSGSLAPRDFSGLDHHWRTWCHEAGFPSFSGEEGTEG